MSARSSLARRLQWLAIHHGPRRRVAVATPQGRIVFDSRDRGIGKSLYLQRGYELDSIREALGLLRAGGWLAPGGNIIDVGANIGVTVIPLLAEGGFERAFAIEPEPANFELLRHNLERNGLSNRVIAVGCALSDAEGSLELELSPDNWGDHRLRPGIASPTGVDGFRESRRRTVNVPVRTLDGLMAETPALPPGSIRLVWLDIQGHEAQFMRGARGLLGLGVPVVSEFWPYGLRRAGTGPAEYVATVSGFFEQFVPLPGDGNPRPIAELAGWFAALSQPKQMGQIILLPRAPREAPKKVG